MISRQLGLDSNNHFQDGALTWVLMGSLVPYHMGISTGCLSVLMTRHLASPRWRMSWRSSQQEAEGLSSSSIQVVHRILYLLHESRVIKFSLQARGKQLVSNSSREEYKEMLNILKPAQFTCWLQIIYIPPTCKICWPVPKGVRVSFHHSRSWKCSRKFSSTSEADEVSQCNALNSDPYIQFFSNMKTCERTHSNVMVDEAFIFKNGENGPGMVALVDSTIQLSHFWIPGPQ